MAGPGGGPPRKSHTKSRKGCKTCKKRHIRCDETFPQCRNCSKHNCRCDYMDMPAAGEEPMKGSRPPDLMMTPDMQHVLDNWRITGDSPFPELRSSDRMYWTHFSTIDLRLVHHMASLSIDMHRRGYDSCTAWAPKMPILIAVAQSSDFVMSAVLALSASHLAWQTKNPETENLAYYHRGVALKGLHEAIGAFSRENSEAILAASMLLSWQATEWRSWASLQQGVSTVMNAMRPWANESELASYLEGQRLLRARTPVTPTYPANQLQPHSEDLSRLEQATQALHDLRLRLANHEELLTQVDQLLDYLQALRRDFPLQAPEEAFERLQTLRSSLFWLPPAMFRPNESDVGAIAVLSHYYAVALALEPLFPEIGGSYLGSMSVAPLEKMHSILISRRASQLQDSSAQVALALLEVPISILSAYKARQRQIAQNLEAYRHSPRSPYARPSMQLSSTPEASPAALYSNSPTHSPGNLRVPGTSYFPPQPNSGSGRRDSSTSIPRLMSERSMSAGSPLAGPQVTYPAHPQGGYEMASGIDFPDSSAYQSYGINTRFVTPSQLWA